MDIDELQSPVNEIRALISLFPSQTGDTLTDFQAQFAHVLLRTVNQLVEHVEWLRANEHTMTEDRVRLVLSFDCRPQVEKIMTCCDIFLHADDFPVLSENQQAYLQEIRARADTVLQRINEFIDQANQID